MDMYDQLERGTLATSISAMVFKFPPIVNEFSVENDPNPPSQITPQLVLGELRM
jgi:hypothetical protein